MPRQRSRAVPPAQTPKPPPGYSYTREKDERAYRLKALHQEHPTADCRTLAELYRERHGRSLSRSMVAASLRLAGVRLGEAKHLEVAERPKRLAELLATMRSPTRDKLAAAYRAKWGIELPYDVISTTLRSRGIRLIEPARKPDREEVEERPSRLFELAEEHPTLTYDQLGKLYETKYGLRLSPSTVAHALRASEVYRHRLVDAEELAARPRRLQALAASHPDWSASELTQEYARLYDEKLHPGTVQQTLHSLGIYRRLPVQAGELTERGVRLQDLAEKYPHLPYAQLVLEYQVRYNTKLSVSTVEETLRGLGVYRQRPVDSTELMERRDRILSLRREHPKLSAEQLAKLYLERHGVQLHPNQIAEALSKPKAKDLHAERERRERPRRLEKLCTAYPNWTYRKLAQKYRDKYGYTITELQISRILNSLGIYRSHQPTADERQERLERLRVILAESPHLTKTEAFEEYQRRFGEKLNAHSTRETLRRQGVYLSRAEIMKQRIERLKSIAAERPDWSTSEVIREYGRRYGEPLNILSTLTSLRRRGIVL